MIRRLGLLLWVLSFLTAEAGASERLPDWLSVSPSLGTFSADGDPETPPAEALARWQAAGHGYVDLLWTVDISVRRSGEVISRTRLVRYFLSESGTTQGGNLEFWADAARDRASVDAAYSESASGDRTPLDPETIEVLPDQTPNVFSDWERVILPVPGLEPGHRATYVGTRRFQSGDFPLPWSREIMLGSAVPVARVEIVVSVEEGAPEIVWQTNDPGLACERQGRGVACVRLDLPAIAIDRDVLSYRDLVPSFYVGFVQDWAGVQAAVWGLVEAAALPTPALREKLAELEIDSSLPPEERLLRLLRFVADEIRYVSLAHGDGTVVPRKAETTLSRRYGDCKDKVTLLVALGRLVDLELTPVLTSSERKDTSRVMRPSSSYFDHMIACLGADPSEAVCVDPTQAYAGLELPPQLAGAIALPLTPASVPALTRLATRDFGWEISVSRTRRFERDGSIALHDIRTFTGPGAPMLRADLLALSSADRRAQLEAEYRQAFGATAMPTFSLRSLRDAAQPHGIESQITIPGGYASDRKAFLDFDRWLVYYAQTFISVNRHHPYRMLGLRYSAEERISLCCAKADHYGAALEFESDYGSLRRSFHEVDGDLVVKTVLELPAALIPAAEVPRFEAFVMQSLRESGVWISWR